MEENKKFIEPMIFDNPEQDRGNKQLIKLMDFDVRTKSVEEKVYIILYKIYEEEEIKNEYSICYGRTEAYNDIKNKLISGIDIDLYKSKIITETKQTETSSGDRKYFMIPYDECISIYSFCISVRGYYSDDEFDIDDYNDGEGPEEVNIPSEFEDRPTYLTPAQLEYKKLLEASMKRDKFLSALKKEKEDAGNN